MFNIIVLYHYVMAFLVGVIIFTFIFIFLSFFRTYFFFNYKTYYQPQNFCSFSEFLAYFRSNLFNFRFFQAYENIISYIRISIIRQKNKHLVFYKQDIRASLTDQITHAPLLEFLWVIFPALILVAIAYPSIILLYYNEAYVEPIFNITVIGNQWFWTYEYNDFNLLKLFKRHITSDKTFFKKFNKRYMWLLSISHKAHNIHYEREFKVTNKILDSLPQRITVDCNMIIAKDPKFLRLLTTDQCLVIPAKTPIRFLITSADVIHSWAIPSYGIKLDAVPGRINQQILTVPLMGTSWGQCSELCGVNHAFMPIEIKVLAFSDFLYFIQLKIKEILLPHLEVFYSHRVRFIRRYIKKVYNFYMFRETNVFPAWGAKAPWFIYKEMRWDITAVRHKYSIRKMFYFVFLYDIPGFAEKQKILGDAVRLARRIFYLKAVKQYKLPGFYHELWRFYLFSLADLKELRRPPFSTLSRIYSKCPEVIALEKYEAYRKEKERTRVYLEAYKRVRRIIDSAGLKVGFKIPRRRRRS